jgi:phosphatidylserine decarboxylase
MASTNDFGSAINFALTNRIPRLAVTLGFGWFSRLQSRHLARLSIALWRRLSDLDLSDSAVQDFDSIHSCFTRKLVPGARPVDPSPNVMVSPCDAIVGAHGTIAQGQMFQAKGMPYSLNELLGSSDAALRFRGATYVTLRLTAQMYHRFHSPADSIIERVDYVSGDCWNVNPPALARIPKLFCRNERAIIHAAVPGTDERYAVVAVAAILVASIRLHFLDVLLHLRYRGTNPIHCRHVVAKGDELGWFEHGSTIIVLAAPGWRLATELDVGARIKMGQQLFCRTELNQA